MKKRQVVIKLLVLTLLLLPLQSYAATPSETIQTQVNKVLDILRDPALKSASRDVKAEKITQIITEIFDQQELARRTLGREWKKLNDAQQKEFVQLFSKLLENNYIDRILEYTNEKVVFGKENMLDAGKAEVESQVLTADGKQIPLYYRMIEKDGQWRVYDVIIEGISMVQNYRSQFRDILSKDTPEKLLEILRDKVKKGSSAS